MEGFTLALGAAVVKSAAKLWLGDLPIAADATASAIDALFGKLASDVDRRRLRRMFEQLEEAVADRLKPLLEREFRALDEGEQAAAVSAVRETLERAALTDADLFAFDLDAGYLDRHLRAAVPGQPARFALSESGTAFYDRVLRECCGTLVEITKTLPRFQPGALTELLRRDTEILTGVREVLRRIPDRRSADDFESDYRQQVVALLDRMEYFGAPLSEASRRYPLSVAYLSLSASAQDLQNARIEEVLAGSSRLLIRGQAGAGKTTLLQWLAVRCAGRDLPTSLRSWGDLLPFFIRLREYAKDELPDPARFLRRVGRHIADEMPAGWVQQRLRTGHAVVLVDGVDELPSDRREAARNWLHELITAFPHARYVVTSRPSAVEEGWLDQEEFTVADLQPMTPRDVRAFVRRWHEAMRAQTVDQDEHAELEQHEQRVLEAVSGRSVLRQIAETPLLCALLCALNRDRRGEIPNDRMALYRTALELLLGRRDEERGLEPLQGLFQTEQLLLLQDIAYWLAKNGESDAEKERVLERVAARLESLGRIAAGPDDVLRYLLERTGLLREPVAGRVDFVHKSFQEYLAAKAAVEADEIGLLIGHADHDQWREVIVLAAGHATRRQADKLMEGLLELRFSEGDRRHYRDLVAISCLETLPDLDPRLRSEVRRRANGLVPPQSAEAVSALAKAGPFVVDLLARHEDYSSEEQAVFAIETAALVGGEDAMRFLTKFGSDPRPRVIQQLVDAAFAFDLEEFAVEVLRDLPAEDVLIDVLATEGFTHLRHMRHLRRLLILWRRDGNVRDLRSLKSLTHLDIYNPEGLVINLADVAHLQQLTSLKVQGPARNWSLLTELRSLSDLTLEYQEGFDRVEDLDGLRRLRRLELHDVEGHNDLACLGFLEAPQSLGIFDWPDLRDISGLRRWAGTLDSVALAGCPVTDLGPLRELTNLRRLNLWDTGDEQGLDLLPLAGMRDLRVIVAPDQDVRGAELLGPGSSVGVTV